jgi:ProP effector
MKSMNTISSAAESVDATTPSPADTPNTEATIQQSAQESSAPVSPVETPSEPSAESAPAEAPAAAAPGAAAAPPSLAGGPPTPSARALLKQLQQQFPAFRDCLPLAIGIDKQLLARIPGLDRKTMRAALGIHTGSMRYLRAMEKATQRFDLDGVAGAEVTDTHRLHAKEQLQLRFKKEAERKKAEKAAEAEAEAARLRQEKLQQLASKFSRG